MKYEPHPASLAFPLLAGKDWLEFRADVEAVGLVDDMVLCRGAKPRSLVLLDGKNRQRACDELGITTRYRTYDGDNPIVYCIAVNLRRRHMNGHARMIAAARLLALPVGRPKKIGRSAELSAAEASHLFDIPERSLGKAKAILKRGVPELVAAAEQGDIAIDTAELLARMPKREQRAELAAAVAGVTDLREVTRQEHRLTAALRLTDSEIIGLQALSDVGADHRDPKVRAGVVTLRRIVPALIVPS